MANPTWKRADAEAPERARTAMMKKRGAMRIVATLIAALVALSLIVSLLGV